MKKTIALLLSILVTSLLLAQNKANYQLSSHILDITTGKPAEQVIIQLQKLNKKNQWINIDTKRTDSNGRVENLLPYNTHSNNGTYKMIFWTADYFAKNNVETFYPFIEVVFIIQGSEHYHVPITVSPFGYATYKGN